MHKQSIGWFCDLRMSEHEFAGTVVQCWSQFKTNTEVTDWSVSYVSLTHSNPNNFSFPK